MSFGGSSRALHDVEVSQEQGAKPNAARKMCLAARAALALVLPPRFRCTFASRFVSQTHMGGLGAWGKREASAASAQGPCL